MLEEEVIIFVSFRAGGLMSGVHAILNPSYLANDLKASHSERNNTTPHVR